MRLIAPLIIALVLTIAAAWDHLKRKRRPNDDENGDSCP